MYSVPSLKRLIVSVYVLRMVIHGTTICLCVDFVLQQSTSMGVGGGTGGAPSAGAVAGGQGFDRDQQLVCTLAPSAHVSMWKKSC